MVKIAGKRKLSDSYLVKSTVFLVLIFLVGCKFPFIPFLDHPSIMCLP